jgi:ABC-type antimicrobial peptide transport system permease subunit
MRNLTKDYVISEILDTISLMQLNKETVPVIDHIIIEQMAEAFIFSWNEVGDYEANFDQCLLEHLRDEFKYNYK